jgi:hypothetical protein
MLGFSAQPGAANRTGVVEPALVEEFGGGIRRLDHASVEWCRSSSTVGLPVLPYSVSVRLVGMHTLSCFVNQLMGSAFSPSYHPKLSCALENMLHCW